MWWDEMIGFVKTLGPRAGVIDLGAPLVGVTLLRFATSPCSVQDSIPAEAKTSRWECLQCGQLLIGQNGVYFWFSSVALLDANGDFFFQISHLGDRSERTFHRLSQCVSGTMDLGWKLLKRIGSWKETNLVARNCTNSCSLWLISIWFTAGIATLTLSYLILSLPPENDLEDGNEKSMRSLGADTSWAHVSLCLSRFWIAWRVPMRVVWFMHKIRIKCHEMSTNLEGCNSDTLDSFAIVCSCLSMFIEWSSDLQMLGHHAHGSLDGIAHTWAQLQSVHGTCELDTLATFHHSCWSIRTPEMVVYQNPPWN